MEGARDMMRNAVEISLASLALKQLNSPVLEDTLRQRIDFAIIRTIHAAGLLHPRPPGGQERLGALFGKARDRKYAEELAVKLLPKDLQPVLTTLLSPDLAAVEEKLISYINQPQRDVDEWLAHIIGGARWSTDWIKSLALHFTWLREL